MTKEKMKEVFEELRDSKRKQDETRNFQNILSCFASEENKEEVLRNILATQDNKMNFLKCYYDLSEDSQNKVRDMLGASVIHKFKNEFLHVLNDETTKHMHYVVKFCDYFIENRIPKAKEEILELFESEEKRRNFRKGIKGIFHAIHNKVNDYGYGQVIDGFSDRIASYLPSLENSRNEPNKEIYLKVLNKIEYGINLARSYDNFMSMMMPPVFAQMFNPLSGDSGLPKAQARLAKKNRF